MGTWRRIVIIITASDQANILVMDCDFSYVVALATMNCSGPRPQIAFLWPQNVVVLPTTSFGGQSPKIICWWLKIWSQKRPIWQLWLWVVEYVVDGWWNYDQMILWWAWANLWQQAPWRGRPMRLWPLVTRSFKSPKSCGHQATREVNFDGW